jgi:hypothetical protein
MFHQKVKSEIKFLALELEHDPELDLYPLVRGSDPYQNVTDLEHWNPDKAPGSLLHDRIQIQTKIYND